MRAAALATLALALLAGCHDPIRDPYRPDPVPRAIARPSASPVGYFPDRLSTYQFVPAGDVKPMLRATIAAATGGTVVVTTSVLDDAELIDSLRVASGHGAMVYVTLDDGDDGQLGPNQKAYDELTSSNVTVGTPHHASSTHATVVSHVRSTSLMCGLADGTTFALMVLSGPLTRAGLAGPDIAVITRNLTTVGAAGSDFSSLLQGRSLTQQDMSLADGPGLMRNAVDSWLAAATKSVAIACNDASDPATVTRLGGLAHAGAAVRVLLPAGATSQRDALLHAGVTSVRLATSSSVPAVCVLDGKRVVVGADNLSAQSLDHDRQTAIALDDPDQVSGVSQAFEVAWGLGS